MIEQSGKLTGVESWETLAAEQLVEFARKILSRLGCDDETSRMVANHLVDANLAGVDSHGVVRLSQYARQLSSGYMSAEGRPQFKLNEFGMAVVDGHGGFGMPAMALAVERGIEAAKRAGTSVIAVVNCGHTGRLGEFVETAAEANCLAICLGGGAREAWRQVAPYGGRKARLPTNPYAFGIPGGAEGAVTLDFATSAIAGGWVAAAKSAGAGLPQGSIIDAAGKATTDPDDYLQGGALLPAAGPKGYGLGLLAELLGGAMLAPVTTEMNWLLICIDLERFQDISLYRDKAEEILSEMRDCPPADGHARVEIPGERERAIAESRRVAGIAIPTNTWSELVKLGAGLGVSLV